MPRYNNKMKVKHIAILSSAAILAALGCLALKASDQEFKISKNFDIFFSVYKEVNTNYVDQPDPDKLIPKAINSMLGSLDPYTTYIPEQDKEDYQFQISGEYGGVGAIIQLAADTNFVQVKEIYSGTPSHKVGLRSGDRFVSIDGISMQGKDVSFVSQNLRGKAGSVAKVVIWRPGVDKNLNIDITREVIKVPAVEYYGMLPNNIGYISLRGFETNCAQDVREAFLELRDKKGAKMMILDLRDNPGGLLDESLKLVNLFVPQNSKMLDTRGRRKLMNRVYTATDEPIDTIMPLCVMINRASASASEIVAGALQDLDRAVIVGQRSFGKGLVQMTREVAYDGYVKVTSAKYYTPSGRCIQAIDYSSRDENGAVGYVPDSLISEFSTKHGRKVYDGGGISPDVLLSTDKYKPIVLSMLTGDYPFRYFLSKQIKGQKVDLDDNGFLTAKGYEDFRQFLTQQKNFTYRTLSQDAFERTISLAKAEGLYDDNKAEFDRMLEAVKPNLERDMEAEARDIKYLVEVEAIRATQLRRAAVRHELNYDAQLDSTCLLLQDANRYAGLLSGQVPSHAGDKPTRNKK